MILFYGWSSLIWELNYNVSLSNLLYNTFLEVPHFLLLGRLRLFVAFGLCPYAVSKMFPVFSGGLSNAIGLLNGVFIPLFCSIAY